MIVIINTFPEEFVRNSSIESFILEFESTHDNLNRYWTPFECAADSFRDSKLGASQCGNTTVHIEAVP